MGKSFINLRPLIDSKKGMFCHLLEIDDTKIVVDCGIGQDFDYSIYDSIAETINGCDGILLTSFDVAHMGAVGLFPDVPVYCSIPTAVLGRIVLDDFQSRLGERILNLFTPKQIKFSQPFKINDVEVSSFNAGYIVGNGSFKITKDLQTVVVCYNLNHRKEHFLDGFHSSSIESPDIFITNSSYVKVPTYTTKSRDESILKSISGSAGKTIISVSYTRLLELLCILHRENIMVVSMHGKLFIERAKAMIEWAGPRAGELLSSVHIEFGRVSDIDNQRIIVVLNETHPFGYLGTILDKFNSPENSLLLFDRNVGDFHPELLNIYEFSYTHKELEVPKQQEDVQESGDSSDNAEFEHWLHTKKTVFLHGGYDRRYMFPHIKKRKQNNQYGEAVRFEFEKKAGESALKDIQPENVEVIETASLVKTGIAPLLTIRSLDTFGVSDSMSCKTIIESLGPGRVILTDDYEEGALYLSTSFNLSKIETESMICSDRLSLGSVNVAAKVLISEKIMDLEFKKLLNKRVSKFLASRRGNFVELAGNYEQFTIGAVNLPNIKKSLIESGFKVESSDSSLLVNNGLTILFDGSGLSIEAEDNNLLIGVREILYRFIAIV